MNFAYCTDHRPVQPSRIRSAVNQLCFVKPSALIYVCARWSFFFPFSLFFSPSPTAARGCKQGSATLSRRLPPSLESRGGGGAGRPQPHRVTRASSFSRKAFRCTAAAEGAKGLLPRTHPWILICLQFFFLPPTGWGKPLSPRGN